MEQLLKLLSGLLHGEFKLIEYTRSNNEKSNGTLELNFGFKVIKKPHSEK